MTFDHARPRRTFRPRLILVGPLPPPRHGVSISTSLILSSRLVNDRFRVEHLDTSDHRSRATIAQWDVTNVRLGLLSAARLVLKLFGRETGVLYLPLSQSSGGFLRDSMLINLAAARGWSVAAHLRGSEFASHFYGQTGPVLRSWIRATLRRLSSVAVMGEDLRPVFGGLVEDDRIVVVPNGTPDITLGMNERDPRHVLFLSNLRRRKGVVEALEAALHVISANSKVTFTFAGESDDDALLAELRSRARPAEEQIRFVSVADDARKADLLASASIFLFPPLMPEGHPRVVLEAMAAGLAIVTTARGAIPETVRDGVDGYVLSDPDPAALATCLTRLLTNDDLRAGMGDAARQRYLDEFTQERADERLVDWLGQLVRGPNTPRRRS